MARGQIFLREKPSGGEGENGGWKAPTYQSLIFRDSAYQI